MTDEEKFKVYITGPFINFGNNPDIERFYEKERQINQKIADICEKVGLETFLPQRDMDYKDRENPGLYISRNKSMEILNSDMVIANLNLGAIDPIVFWDLAYGYAHHKYVVGFSPKKQEINPILEDSVLIFYSLKDFRSWLKEFKKSFIDLPPKEERKTIYDLLRET